MSDGTVASAFGRSRMDTAFTAALREVVARVPGARGAVFLDGEGEAVDEFAEVTTSEIRILGAHLGILLALLKERGTLWGAPRELCIEASRATFLVLSIDNRYLVALEAAPRRRWASCAASSSGRSRSCARRCDAALMRRSPALVVVAFLLASARAPASPDSRDYRLDSPAWNGLSRLAAEAAQQGCAIAAADQLDWARLGPRDVLFFIYPQSPVDPVALGDYLTKGGRLLLADDFGSAEPAFAALELRRTPAHLDGCPASRATRSCPSRA